MLGVLTWKSMLSYSVHFALVSADVSYEAWSFFFASILFFSQIC